MKVNTSLIQSILASFENIELSISATTRSPREGEVEGKHYFFVTENEFNSLKEEEAFIECAIVHNYQYGTLHKYIDEIYLILNSLGYVDNEIKESIKIITINEKENSLLLNSSSAEEKAELMDKHLKEILIKLSEKST